MDWHSIETPDSVGVETDKTIQAEAEHIKATPKAQSQVADSGIVLTGQSFNVGKINVEAGDNSGSFDVINTAGTITTVKATGPALFTHTKDTASSVNVYWETDQFKIQNTSGGALDISYSFSS